MNNLAAPEVRENHVAYDGDSLQCPRCKKESFIHHTNITSYERGEDDEQVLVTTVNADGGAFQRMENSRTTNPSLRRNAVTIRFTCEQCGPGLELNVVQHKGETYLYWSYAE